MDDKLTEIIVITDRSGSMDEVKADTIGGFNTFLKGQQELKEGRCLLTYCQFDTVYEVVHEALPIEEMKPLDEKTFVPRGGTALLDAVGKTIDEVGARLAKIPEAKRPGNVVVVIMTDGEENSSSDKYKNGKLKEMVKRQAADYDWTFIFLGQNIDAFAEGDAIGFSNQNTHMFVGNVSDGGTGVRHAYMAANAAVGGTRKKVARGLSKDFMTQEREVYTSALVGDEDALDNLSSSSDLVTPSSTTDSTGSSGSDSL